MEEVKYFLSYARKDEEFVLKLANELRAVDVNLWLDKLDILGGQHWDRAVEKALKICQGMIVVLSPESVASDNVMDEVLEARKKEKSVVPILLRSCDIPLCLRRIQYVDFTADYAAGFSQLLRALHIDQPSQLLGAARLKEPVVRHTTTHAQGMPKEVPTPVGSTTTTSGKVQVKLPTKDDFRRLLAPLFSTSLFSLTTFPSVRHEEWNKEWNDFFYVLCKTRSDIASERLRKRRYNSLESGEERSALTKAVELMGRIENDVVSIYGLTFDRTAHMRNTYSKKEFIKKLPRVVSKPTDEFEQKQAQALQELHDFLRSKGYAN